MKTVSDRGVTGPATDSSELNDQLVHALEGAGRITSPEIAAAFRATPRHLFVPDVELREAYRDDYQPTERDGDGRLLSSVSAPWLVAQMLEYLRPQPGNSVLEIGSGGYNAVLLHQLVGDAGAVTSIDIDPVVTERARRCLRAAGLEAAVRLLTGDGAQGVPDAAPYDRIEVTVQAAAIEQTWLDQLAPGGVLVVPLRVRGLGRLVALTRDGEGHYSGGGWLPCGFVPMRGEAASSTQMHALIPGARVRVDGTQPLDTEALTKALDTTGSPRWSGVEVGASEGTRPVIDLWFATVLDTYGTLLTDPKESALQALPGGTPLTWNTDSTAAAYVTMRPVEGQSGRYEYGVIVHGEDEDLAEALVEHLREWGRDHRGGPGPVLHVYDSGTDPATMAPGRALERPGAPMVLTWPKD
ncbi:methyltransferase, FxLD system [Streptomyces sp. NRRL S-350]|uniref:methyltransferase, FxLD system n=1 Tax=Streptomyces sp. NRRL S-350 TaxID=1463902 RepID=UPI00056152BF|nr:methyltransferase, FxLD system [Streptomyces sp. NRRL S-350]